MSKEPGSYTPEGGAVPIGLLDAIIASRAKIEALDAAGLERFAQELGDKYQTPNVTGRWLLHVLKKNPRP